MGIPVPAAILCGILAIQIAAFYGTSRKEFVPTAKPLDTMEFNFGDWRMLNQRPVEPDILAELKADDTILRDYVNSSGYQINLYIAYFKTQRTGVVPHSPKHCLPANGYVWIDSRITDVTVPGVDEPFPVNRYVVSRRDNKSLVLYWYQSSHRAVASEYMAKVYLVADAFRYNRSDTSMVRIVAPIITTVEAAEKFALDFLNSSYMPIRRHLPG